MAESKNQGKNAVRFSNLTITISVIGLVILLNILGLWVYGSWDLTDTKRYTLSKVSVDAVRKLPDLHVNVYVSPDLPPTIDMGMGRVLDLRGLKQEFLDKLRQYQSESNGSMTLNIITKDVVNKAKQANLRLFAGQKAQVNNGVLEFKKYVLGATFQYKNQMEVFPLALQPEFYEYEITKRLLRLRDKYRESLVMKDVLNAGEHVHTAVQKCKKQINSYKSGKKAQGLASLLSGGKDVDAIRLHLDKVRKACENINNALADAEKLKGKQENLDDVIQSGKRVAKTLDALYTTISNTKQGNKAGLVLRELDAAFSDLNEDYRALKDAPGRRSIGFICGHNEFCPFPSKKQLVNPSLAMVFSQKNPMIGQFINQLSQLERRINGINEQLNKALFRRKGFSIKRIDPDTKIGADVKALIVFGPEKSLDDKTIYKIDQFLLHGHTVVFFTNNWDAAVYNIKAAEGDLTGRKMSFSETHLQSRPGNLKDLLKAYGVKLNQDLVLGLKHFGNITVYQLIRQGGFAFQTQRAFPYPLLPTLFDFDSTSPIVRGMTEITLPFVSTMQPTTEAKADKDLKITALIMSGDNSAAVTGDDLNLSPPVLLQSLPGRQATGSKPVALVLSGRFTSYFATKDRPKDYKNDPDFVKTGHGRLLVMGTNMGLENISPEKIMAGFSMSQLAGNGMGVMFKAAKYMMNFQNWQLRLSQIAGTVQEDINLLDNIMEWSVQKASMAEIRAKGFNKRPLADVSRAARMELILLFVLGLPLLFILFGVVRFVIRRKRIGG